MPSLRSLPGFIFLVALIGCGPTDSGPTDAEQAALASRVCASAKEHAALTLRCPSGETISSVDFASYGTPTGASGAYATGSCNATNSLTVVRSACVGKSTCTVSADNATFGDPCRGTVKRLDVQASCASSSAALTITSALNLSSTQVASGQTLHGTVTYKNESSSAVTVQKFVLTSRPPGGTNGGGPFDDFAPVNGATLAPGASFTVNASRAFTAADPQGTWYAFATYEDAAGTWHDGPKVSFSVTGGSTCTPTTCVAQGKNCGSLPDGCGGTLQCGTCTAPLTCGGGGVVNVCGGGGGTGVQASGADAFVDSIGINTHLDYNGVYTNNWTTLKNLLVASGIRHHRGSPIDVAHINELGAAGVKLTALMGTDASGNWAATLDQFYATVRDSIRSSVDAVEGVNEWDLSGDSNWASELRAHQQRLWSLMKGDARTSSLPVFGPSIAFANNAPALGDIHAWADTGNIHPYPGGRVPSVRVDTDLGASQHYNVAGKPVVATETGYHTALRSTSSHLPASEAAEAVYFPRLFLGYFALGIPRTMSYELIDQGADQTNSEATFGLLHSDYTPKPAYNAVKSLIALLADPGTAFTPGKLDFTLGGKSAATRTVLLQKRNGEFWLAVWEDTSVWDPNTKTTLSPPDTTVTLGLGTPARSVTVYMPNRGTAPVQTLPASGGSVTSSAEVRLLRIVP